MEKQLVDLINGCNKLIDSNANLTQTVNVSLQQAVKSMNSQKELLKHCGELYELLDSKNNKTRVEEICIKKLYNLITHNEAKE